MTKKQEYTYFHLWRQACQAKGWKTTDNAKRHQIHVNVLGYDTGHAGMDNAEIDLIFPAFRLLANDTDIDAAVAFFNPENGEKKRLLWKIKHLAAEPYIQSIALDRFDTRQWEELSMQQLTMLRNTLQNRMHSKHRRAAAAAPATEENNHEELAVAESNCPF